eukprot:TRINITY_DN1554_c1_g1_i2.p2 TRINITY_DN1554_c1_g1~~TRINITY_DN1554_c1_g1_i2.p2  ORF type:complete len:133 (+),score=9.04 TRINITY_DN1554_c1_g1_i2:57-455(+)
MIQKTKELSEAVLQVAFLLFCWLKIINDMKTKIKKNRSTSKKKSTKKTTSKAIRPKKLTEKLKKAGITQEMLNRAAKEGGISLKTVKKQSGTSSAFYDKMAKALPPGKRLSRNGKIYHEIRKNRSDRKGNLQ